MSESTTVLVQTETVGATVVVTGATVLGTVPIGPQGPPGPDGPAGADGAPGPAGATGATGPQGPEGPQGETGAAGPAGDTGPAGGPQGETGADGEDGLSAYEVAVAEGFIGDEAAWLASLVGPEGPQGETGATGATGATGPQGPAGPEGPEGPQGETGPAGSDATVNSTNVAAAGAVMETDTSTAAMQFVVDEDDMASDSDELVPTQQSVKAYVDSEVASLGGGPTYVSLVPGGNLDNTSGTMASWSGTASLTVPAWAVTARVAVAVNGVFGAAGNVVANMQVRIGSVDGSKDIQVALANNTRSSVAWSDQITLGATGNSTIEVRASRASGSVAIRADASSDFTFLVFFSA